MQEHAYEIIKNRQKEKCYFVVYCITTEMDIKTNQMINKQKLYTFFGCDMEGKKKYIESILDDKVGKASEWYDFFQKLKNTGIEKVIFGLLPRKRELRDAFRLNFPDSEIFTSTDYIREKLGKYKSVKHRDIINKEVRGLILSRNDQEFKLNYEEFIDSISKHNFLKELIIEEIEEIKKAYKYPYQVRRIIYAFNYIIEMQRRFEEIRNSNIYTNKEEFIRKCSLSFMYSEKAVHYYKEEWSEVLNQVYNEKKELIKQYL